MKHSHLISFAVGIVTGAALGILVSDEEKRRVQKVLGKQADWLKKEYEGPIKGTAAKVKDFVKEHLA